MLYRELKILSKLDSPNIAKYFENYEDENYIYICMELCDGGDLDTYVQDKKRPLYENEIAKLLPPLLGALSHCHAQNIIHRDIKPANITCDKAGDVKFIDFGVAISTKKGQGGELLSIGSPVFMSPECFTGHYDQKTDIWSLGVTLYFLASGEFPFEMFKGDSMDKLIHKI